MVHLSLTKVIDCCHFNQNLSTRNSTYPPLIDRIVSYRYLLCSVPLVDIMVFWLFFRLLKCGVGMFTSFSYLHYNFCEKCHKISFFFQNFANISYLRKDATEVPQRTRENSKIFSSFRCRGRWRNFSNCSRWKLFLSLLPAETSELCLLRWVWT